MENKEAAGILRAGIFQNSGLHTSLEMALEMGAEAIELLDFFARDPGSVSQISSTDERLNRKWGYRTASGRFTSRSKTGDPLEFMDALRAARKATT